MYREKAREKKWRKDETTLGRMNYEIITKQLCGYCSKEFSNNSKCCENFSVENLRDKEFIKHMKIVRLRDGDECNINNNSDSEDDD